VAIPGERIHNFYLIIKNMGDSGGRFVLRILNYTSSAVYETAPIFLEVNDTFSFSAGFKVPSEEGTYSFTIEVCNNETGSIDDIKTFTLIVRRAPRFLISEYVLPGITILSKGSTHGPHPELTIDFDKATPTIHIAEFYGETTALFGQKINGTITIKNDGVEGGKCTIRIVDENGSVIHTESAWIPAGSSHNFTYTITAPSSLKELTRYDPALLESVFYYKYIIEVYNEELQKLDDYLKFKVRVAESVFKIMDYPKVVVARPGERVTIEVTLKHYSINTRSRFELTLRDYMGYIVDEVFLGLGSGEAETYTLEFTAPTEEGEYQYRISVANVHSYNVSGTIVGGFLDDAAWIELKVEPSFFGGSTVGETITGVVAVVVVIAVLVLLLRRR